MLLGREFECCGDRLVVREEAGRIVDDAGCGLAGDDQGRGDVPIIIAWPSPWLRYRIGRSVFPRFPTPFLIPGKLPSQ